MSILTYFPAHPTVPEFKWATPLNRPYTNELLPEIKDAVFRTQLQSSDFARLTEQTLLQAQIVPNQHTATKVISAAQKIGIIDPVSGKPVTANIDRNMPNKLPLLAGMSKERELVMLLFFLEEEVARREFFDAEHGDVQQRLQGAELSEGYKNELEGTLKVVLAEKAKLPSQRN